MVSCVKAQLAYTARWMEAILKAFERSMVIVQIFSGQIDKLCKTLHYRVLPLLLGLCRLPPLCPSVLRVQRGQVRRFFCFSSVATRRGNLKVLPRPSIEVTLSRDPCASMICRTRKAPNPVPPAFRVDEPSN